MAGHVLVVRLDSMGDMLAAGPAIRAVAAGADRLTVLCRTARRPAAGCCPGWTPRWFGNVPGS